jgi:hypothetical protein
VPVSVFASAPVVRVGPGRCLRGCEGPEEAGVHEAVVLDEAAADEAFLAGSTGDGRGAVCSTAPRGGVPDGLGAFHRTGAHRSGAVVRSGVQSHHVLHHRVGLRYLFVAQRLQSLDDVRGGVGEDLADEVRVGAGDPWVREWERARFVDGSWERLAIRGLGNVDENWQGLPSLIPRAWGTAP